MTLERCEEYCLHLGSSCNAIQYHRTKDKCWTFSQVIVFIFSADSDMYIRTSCSPVAWMPENFSGHRSVRSTTNNLIVTGNCDPGEYTKVPHQRADGGILVPRPYPFYITLEDCKSVCDNASMSEGCIAIQYRESEKKVWYFRTFKYYIYSPEDDMYIRHTCSHKP